jgi:tetratricopeptide (TPR) repeat protein
MKCRLVPAFIFLLPLVVANAATKNQPPPRLRPGLGEVHHPVSTTNKQAQQFFDQGLNLLFGFNHDAARRSFQRAAELDPKLAMAWWGVALALGTNYNFPVEAQPEKAAYEAIQRSLALQNNASEAERAYINALSLRYSNAEKPDLQQLDLAYRDAMGKLTKRYPDDPDAATLYAESLMNLNPWKLWTKEGKPREGTEEILAVLESVLKRNPNHIGANHYYIHALEASPNPERALPCAMRLEKLAPAAGHLMHMPSHIYARMGDHPGSARCNAMAVAADKKFYGKNSPSEMQAAMLASHNVHFLAYAASMTGDLKQAKTAAAQVVADIKPVIKRMPMLEGFLPTPLIVMLAFERWDEILKTAPPDSSLLLTTAYWHFARGIAFANLGNTQSAENEQSLWREVVAKIPPETFVVEINTAGAVFKIQENLLAAAIARSQRDENRAMDFLRQAITAEDALNYTEPPSWYPSVRPALGRDLMSAKQLPEAEKIFRDDLDRNPRNPHSLAGLRDCLKAQGRKDEAEFVDQQYRAVWKVASSADNAAKR